MNIIAPAIKHDKDCHAGLDPASSLFSGFPLSRGMTIMRYIVTGVIMQESGGEKRKCPLSEFPV